MADGEMPNKVNAGLVLKRKWREGESSPYTGKLSARPAGKPGDSFTFWRICDDSVTPLSFAGPAQTAGIR